MTYPDLESRSAALGERAWRVLPSGNSRSVINRKPHPIYVAEAAGAEIVDVDGNRYIDFDNNVTSLIHGNAYPPVVEAVTKQLARGTAFTMATEVEIELAELLCERVPSFERVRFCNSGTEAVMNLIKASRAFTGRPKIAKVEGLFHGAYDFAEVGRTTGARTNPSPSLLATAPRNPCSTKSCCCRSTKRRRCNVSSNGTRTNSPAY